MKTNPIKSVKPDSTYPGSLRDETIPWPVAVIDIGATSLRMQISEIHLDGTIRKLESFSQAISLGKDAFTKGRIGSETIEDCVHVLRIYRMKLNEYGMFDSRQLRVVATSAVKEAANRLAFIDRVFVATGFEVELLDEAELHRVTFVGALPLIEEHPETFQSASMICEVSGGTTEVLIFKSQDVLFSQSYRQGSLRSRRTLDAIDGPPIASREVMEAQLSRMSSQINRESKKHDLKYMIAVGGDIRFAAQQVGADVSDGSIAELSIDQLSEITNEILQQSTERLVAKYHLSLPEADSLGPALMTYEMIARQAGIESLYVADFNLRDGIIEEMAQGGKWAHSVERQTIRSAIQIGNKFKFDQHHAVHVSKLACQIFDQLAELHQLDQRFKVILEMAAILHEVGNFISNRSYHKHSLYLIRNSEFFGISSKDIELVALVARYHRRASPQPNHDGYSKLDRKGRVSVAKLAAILRIAKALDASRSQRIKNISCTATGNTVSIELTGTGDISLESIEIGKTGQMFNDIFGTKVDLSLAGHK